MTRFSRVLRRVESRLKAPEPERSRILMELAADLEDLYRTYRERGLDDSEARRKAEQWLVPSTSALDSLRSVHVPAFERLLDRLSGTTRGRVELGIVSLVSLIAVGGSLFAALRAGAVAPSAPTLWAVAFLAALGVGAAVRQGYTLFVRGDRLRQGWRGRLHRVLAAAVATALAGLVGAGVRLSLTDAPAGAGADAAAFWSQVATATTVAALGLSASLLLALLWLLLRARADAVVRARADLREAVGALESSDSAPGGE